MRQIENSNYQQVLIRVAKEYAAQSSAPLKLDELCESLSVRIKFVDIQGTARAVVVEHHNTTEIHLSRTYARDGSLDPWARFLVAHELGHIVLRRECRVSPLGESEYWQHEKLCDSFAAALLVPEELLVIALSSNSQTSIGLLAAITKIASVAMVPWQTAASRVAQFISGIAVLVAKKTVPKNSKAPRFRVVASTMADRKEINRFIPPDSALGEAMERNAVIRRVIPLTRQHFTDGALPSCLEATSGALNCHARGSFRMLVRMNGTE